MIGFRGNCDNSYGVGVQIFCEMLLDRRELLTAATWVFRVQLLRLAILSATKHVKQVHDRELTPIEQIRRLPSACAALSRLPNACYFPL
jgi:hypothetical protein